MSQCPCQSGKPYSDCCGPIISGELPAPTAESLMRSRYTAYTVGDVDYIEKTHHPKGSADFDKEAARTWAKESEWQGLDILKTEAGSPEDEEGLVEFVAKYKAEGQSLAHQERAQFKKHDGAWLYLDGKIIATPTQRRESPKVGRNDPCPCGSGKKYKKCCL